MNGDPYDILGVDPDTSEDEIKKKYRLLVKQYHPDLHPGDKTAAAKMSEINEAYELIKSGKAEQLLPKSETVQSGTFTRKGTTFYYEYADPEEAFRSFSGDDPHFSSYADPYSEIESFINSGQYKKAAYVLEQISERNGKWYYYAALIHLDNGYSTDALRFAERACQLDPSNKTYSELYDQLSENFEETPYKAAVSRKIISVVTALMAILFILQFLRPLFYLILKTPH